VRGRIESLVCAICCKGTILTGDGRTENGFEYVGKVATRLSGLARRTIGGQVPKESQYGIRGLYVLRRMLASRPTSPGSSVYFCATAGRGYDGLSAGDGSSR